MQLIDMQTPMANKQHANTNDKQTKKAFKSNDQKAGTITIPITTTMRTTHNSNDNNK